MRRAVKFVDSLGWTWQVHEISAAARSKADDLPQTAGESKGTLYFFSRYVTKKLSDYPRAWRSASNNELERLCRLARALGAVLLSEESSGGDRTAEQRAHGSALPEAPAES